MPFMVLCEAAPIRSSHEVIVKVTVTDRYAQRFRVARLADWPRGMGLAPQPVLFCTYHFKCKEYTFVMKLPGIFEYLTHRGSREPPDSRTSSCFDENQTPVWAYRYKDLGADVRRDPLVRARAWVIVPSGQNILHTGEVLSQIGLDLEIGGHYIRLVGVELSVIAPAALPDLSGPLTELTDSPLPALVV
jgi:hypothetical protein